MAESRIQKKFYLNDFKNNKLLSLCESIDEIYDQLILEFKKDNKKAIVEENNKIIIIIPIEIVKIKEIKIILDKKIYSKKRFNY